MTTETSDIQLCADCVQHLSPITHDAAGIAVLVTLQHAAKPGADMTVLQGMAITIADDIVTEKLIVDALDQGNVAEAIGQAAVLGSMAAYLLVAELRKSSNMWSVEDGKCSE